MPGPIWNIAGVILLFFGLVLLFFFGMAYRTRKRGASSLPLEATTAEEGAGGFRVRLRARIAKSLAADSTSLNVRIANRDVTVTSENKEGPLNKTKWIVLGVRGFGDEKSAQDFGTELRSILQLAALSARLGVDVGEDKPTSWVSKSFARSSGLLKEHERIAPNIHGLAILPDDDHTRFPMINIKATVLASTEHFISALSETGETGGISLGTAANGVRLLNLALMTSEPLAQMVLALSAVEELGQNEKWTEPQKALIEQLAEVAEAALDTPLTERSEVATAIRSGLFRLSLRQGVVRLLSSLALDHLRKEWDRLYGIRSGVFHGTARLSDSELNQAASDTVTMCGQIVLAIVTKQGGRVPSIAKTHYKPSVSSSR